MAKITININAGQDAPLINLGTSPNDKTGDPLRTAFGKLNTAIDSIDANFTELYNLAGADVQIPNQYSNGGKFLTTNGSTLSWATIGYDQSLNTTDSVTFDIVTSELRVNNNIRTSGSADITVAAASDVVIFTAPQWMTGSKLTIVVEGTVDSDGTFTKHTQTCEATVAATYNTSAEPVISIYGLAYTSVNPLATFDVRRGTGDIIEVLAHNNQGTQTLFVKVHATQFVSHFD